METDKDAIAAGTVAIGGVVAICHALAEANLLDRSSVTEISKFMVASVAKSEASPDMQEVLRLAIGDHFRLLLQKFQPES